MNILKRKYIILALILGGVLGYFLLTNIMDDSNLKIGRAKFDVEFATTTEARTQGLSGRTILEEREGMLFVFDAPGDRGFWMKEMNFNLDMIWIDENFIIVDITKEATPESFPKTFSPNAPAQYVLEINGGMSEKKKINIGDTVEFSLELKY